MPCTASCGVCVAWPKREVGSALWGGTRIASPHCLQDRIPRTSAGLASGAHGPALQCLMRAWVDREAYRQQCGRPHLWLLSRAIQTARVSSLALVNMGRAHKVLHLLRARVARLVALELLAKIAHRHDQAVERLAEVAELAPSCSRGEIDAPECLRHVAEYLHAAALQVKFVETSIELDVYKHAEKQRARSDTHTIEKVQRGVF